MFQAASNPFNICKEVNKLNRQLLSLIELYQTDNNLVKASHQALTELYPVLKVRWSRVFGNRWAHLLGNHQEISFSPLKVRLSGGYGLFIDNPDSLPGQEIQEVIITLKDVFYARH